MPTEDRYADGINQPELLWILIALSRGLVDEDEVAESFGVPSEMVETLMTMAGMRGQTAIERAMLRTTQQTPPLVIVRGDDVEIMVRTVEAWTPKDVLFAKDNIPTRNAINRFKAIAKRANVWTNN